MRGCFETSRLVVLLAILSCKPLSADQGFLQASCTLPYPEAMALLQESIVKRGYAVSRVQHVDKGLRQSGYQTGRYRVVFFGRPEQMTWVREHYPALMPYLPLKITLYEAEGYVGASALQPAALSPYFDEQQVQRLLDGWQEDMMAIMAVYGRCGEAGG
jgi:uncharacterized protein (DUF302 family)